MGSTADKLVFGFDEGGRDMADLLGGKGAGVAEMTRNGLPVPPGFTITTEACRRFLASGGRVPAGLWDQVEAALLKLERATGKRFGDPANPLLVSVRSGARFSMPGMMDTLLNLGINDEVAEGMARLSGSRRFALDLHRRFIQLYGKIVCGIDGDTFEAVLTAARRAAGVSHEHDLDESALAEVVESFKRIYRSATGQPLPADPRAQLRSAILAVFSSWNNDRARTYRRLERIPDHLGTACNVQMMVFGNLGEGSGTGVLFTRNPIDGSPELFGDYLAGSQGEDVVAGSRATLPLSALRAEAPALYEQLAASARLLERHYADLQDIEFTVERGSLYILQTRSAKRTGEAAVRVAVDLAEEGLIARPVAVSRVEPRQIEQLIHPRVAADVDAEPIGKGVPASPGAASGQAVFDADTAESWAREGRAVILVRIETSPDDVHGMIAARGVVTATGGTASHAALVARGLGRPCIVGATELEVDLSARRLTAGGVTVEEGDEITIDGTNGAVYLGRLPTVEPVPSEHLQTLLGWADELSRLEVWANADYPRDAARARQNGARGIGLCRTEHMFMEADRLPVVRAMIMADTSEARAAELAKLLPIQRGDFAGIFEIMDGLPVVVRLIDPPLHEFLPDHDGLIEELATLRASGGDPARMAEIERVLGRLEELRESNPMLGLRGVRLSILNPEITRMQVRAIMEAACDLAGRGIDVRPKIMIPLVGDLAELRAVRAELEPVAEAVQAEKGIRVPYHFGTMIELPRAALTAGDIARAAEFFSFGTNDLTQTTFGISRDDAERHFIVQYLERGILARNPFETIDPGGVGRLMRIAVEEGRQTRPDLELGICGEHGGDPESIGFCHRLGLDYVSCSPYRVPVARLAAAQAAMGGAAGASTTR